MPKKLTYDNNYIHIAVKPESAKEIERISNETREFKYEVVEQGLRLYAQYLRLRKGSNAKREMPEVQPDPVCN
jgi:hypothetical protein